MEKLIAVHSEIAVAHVNYCLLAGIEPDPETERVSAAYMAAYIDDCILSDSGQPWDDPHTLKVWRQLGLNSSLLGRWNSQFDARHYPLNTSIARRFSREAFEAFTHFPYFDKPILCVRYTSVRDTSTDISHKYPIALQYYTTYLTFGGKGVLTIGDSQISIQPNDLVLIPPTCRCIVSRAPDSDNWQAYQARFLLPLERWHTADWINKLSIPYLIQLDTKDVDLLEHSYIELNRRLVSTDPVDAQLSHNLLENILLRIKRVAPMATHEGDPRVAKAANFILQHLSEPLDLQAVADHVGVSLRHLRRIFRLQMANSPTEWRSKIKLQMAEDMLKNTCLPISEVAFRAGFLDQLYFSRRFRQSNGCTPTEFRRAARDS